MKNANPVFRSACWLVAMLVWWPFLPACKRSEPVNTTATRPKTVGDYFEIAVGGKTVRTQLAVLQAEMEQGLMHRRDLSRNDGMIFMYERPQQMGFWMRNTPTPLDIGFFDSDGVLVEMYPMHPFDERTVQSQSHDLRFALEVNQGWFRDNGVRVGAKLDVQALAAALKARGFDPRRYGLRN